MVCNMEGNQKIHCNAETCKYNDYNQNKCTLTAIQVTPTQNCKSKKLMNQCVQVMKMRSNSLLIFAYIINVCYYSLIDKQFVFQHLFS